MKLALGRLTLLFAALLVLQLSACDTAEERAEAHYQSGLKYVAAGEIDKALVEFRNVFKLDGEHIQARLAFAGLLVDRQDYDQATGQYLRVLEQEPSNRIARIATAKLMLQFQDFAEAEKNAAAVLAIDPSDIDALAVRSTAYMRLGRQIEAIVIARGILVSQPNNMAALLVLIADDVNGGTLEQALDRSELTISYHPTEIAGYLAKLAVLEKLGKNSEITEVLAKMAEVFPSNKEILATQIGWMLEIGDTDSAIAVLRDVSAKDTENVEAALDLVGLLEREKGIDAAFAELESSAKRSLTNRNEFERALASMLYRRGDEERAVTMVKSLLEAPKDDADKNESAVLLAFILYDQGSSSDALALVETVIGSDESNVDALKIRSQISIDNDKYDEAIADLRTAHDADPADPAVLVLQATAYKLNGSPELSRERLASAVTLSRAQPNIAIEYSRAMVEDGKIEIAESVLTESTHRFPKNRDVLVELANVQIILRDWTNAQASAEKIRGLSANEVDSEADRISVAVLQGQNKIEESIGMLKSMLVSGENGQKESAMLDIVRTHLETGQSAIAENFLRDFLKSSPKDYTGNLLLAGLMAVTNRAEDAESLYNQVIADNPQKSGGYIMLARLLSGQNRLDHSKAVLDAGLAHSEDKDRLLFMNAGFLEQMGDFDGAIAIYSQLFEQAPNSDLLANNLASLLSEHRTDKESLDKAFAVSKRLRDSDFPPYQDTYGWVLYLNGDFDRALAVFAKAEAELGTNPIFMYHQGMAFSRVGQKEQAIALLKRAIEISEQSTIDLPQMEEAKKALAVLEQSNTN